jgi:hypothetical protein
MKTLTNMNKIRLIGAVLVICATAAWATCWNAQYYSCGPLSSMGPASCDNSCIGWIIVCPNVQCANCGAVTEGGFQGCYVNTCEGQCNGEWDVYQEVPLPWKDPPCGCGGLLSVTYDVLPFQYQGGVVLVAPCPGE